MKFPNLFAILLLLSSQAFGQDLVEAFRPAQWRTYIFVSTQMPRSSLVALAREASQAHAVLVLNGFSFKAPTLQATQKLIDEINNDCCKPNGAQWLIHPKLFDRYKVKVAPAFVLALGEGEGAGDFSRLTGDISLANALKYFQESKYEGIRRQSKAVYVTLR
jgi:conjugal transfer pilus assembly protein TrbC